MTASGQREEVHYCSPFLLHEHSLLRKHTHGSVLPRDLCFLSSHWVFFLKGRVATLDSVEEGPQPQLPGQIPTSLTTGGRPLPLYQQSPGSCLPHFQSLPHTSPMLRKCSLMRCALPASPLQRVLTDSLPETVIVPQLHSTVL